MQVIEAKEDNAVSPDLKELLEIQEIRGEGARRETKETRDFRVSKDLKAPLGYQRL